MDTDLTGLFLMAQAAAKANQTVASDRGNCFAKQADARGDFLGAQR
jgi:hypothetical protein